MGFLICTFWLVECLALGGARQRAHDWFKRASAHANDLGLMSEGADTGSGAMLGNYLQASASSPQHGVSAHAHNARNWS